MVKYFGLVKNILDQTLTKVCESKGIDQEEAKNQIALYLQNMREEWFSDKQPVIAYQDPICRFAYLYAHVPANANLCERAIFRTCNDYLESFYEAGKPLKVCAFGGGPGTEVLALAKYLQTHNDSGQPLDVSFSVLDKVAEWTENVNAIKHTVHQSFYQQFGAKLNWPMLLDTEFRPIDMTRMNNYANITDAYSYDLYILNYVVSEVIEHQDDLGKVIARMKQSAPSGARFVFIDRNQNDIQEATEKIIDYAGLEKGVARTTQTNMDGDEQASTMAPYPTLIGRHPRTQWNAFFQTGVVN